MKQINKSPHMDGMTMENKYIQFDLKAESEDGVIEGYGSVFGNEDLGGDIVVAGAFSESIDVRKPKMLWQHDTEKVIGIWDEVVEDARGLKLKGRLAMNTQRGKEAYELVKMGALDGLSIGFRTIDWSWEEDKRYIKKAALWEVSVVTFPMNELARIDAAKAADMTEREMEKLLTQDAGLSRTVARQLMSGGFKAVKGMRDAADDRDALEGLLTALKNRVELLS